MRKSMRFHKRFIHRDLNSWKGPASKRDLLHPKDHANRRWTIHRAEYVQDKTRLDKSNRRYCFYTSNSFLHVGTAHFSFDEMRTQTSGIQERSQDRNRSIGLKINSYRQDFPFAGRDDRISIPRWITSSLMAEFHSATNIDKTSPCIQCEKFPCLLMLE